MAHFLLFPKAKNKNHPFSCNVRGNEYAFPRWGNKMYLTLVYGLGRARDKTYAFLVV